MNLTLAIAHEYLASAERRGRIPNKWLIGYPAYQELLQLEKIDFVNQKPALYGIPVVHDHNETHLHLLVTKCRFETNYN